MNVKNNKGPRTDLCDIADVKVSIQIFPNAWQHTGFYYPESFQPMKLCDDIYPLLMAYI